MGFLTRANALRYIDELYDRVSRPSNTEHLLTDDCSD